VVVVLLRYPAYLDQVRTYGTAYSGFLALPVWQVGLVSLGSAYLSLALLTRVALRGVRTQNAGSSAAFLAGAIGFWLAALLQRKGWSYHYLPVQGLSLIALGALLAEATGSAASLTTRAYRGMAAGVLALALAGPAVDAMLQLVGREPIDRRGLDPNLEALLPTVRAAATEGSVLIMSTNIASSFPLISEAGAHSALRQPSLAMLGAAYSTQLDGAGPVQPRPLTGRSTVERRVSAELAADFRRNRPVLLLVIREDPSVRAWGGARRFDYLAYFRADPAMREILADYHPAGVIGDYLALVRTGSRVRVPAEP